jgi:hypothetical protein
MNQSPKAIYAVSLLFMVMSCSNASESSSQRVKKPGTSDQTGGSGSDSNLSCDQQWSLAVQQQKVGAVFVYQGTIKLVAIANVSMSYSRTETVTAASDTSITRKIDISPSASIPQLVSYVEKLKTPQLTLTKDKFLQTCNKADGQPVTVTGLGGNISVGSLKDESVTLKSGKNVTTKRVDAEVKSVTLGSYTVGDADVVIYISKQYPVLPLKQTLTLNQVSEASLNGAVLEEEIVNGLPTN